MVLGIATIAVVFLLVWAVMKAENRLSFYADEKGQTMTLAIERLLKQSLDDSISPAGKQSTGKEAISSPVLFGSFRAFRCTHGA